MKKKIIAGASLVILVGIVAAAVLLSGFTGNGNAQSATQVRATALVKGELTVSVSATGTVYSASSTNVYSNLNYPVKTVLVSVGDAVEEGDVLAELDVSDLELDIAQKKAALASSKASAQQNLISAQNDLETYRRNSENGYDSNLLSAQSAVTTAELDVHSAELDVQSAESDVRVAEHDLRDAKSGEGDAVDDEEIDRLRDAYHNKLTAEEKSHTNLEKAKANLEKAKASYEAAKVSSGDSLDTYQNKVKSAQISTDFSDQEIALQKLEAELEKSTITAPVSGTVTSVSAVEGGSGNGLLFIIQDTDSLKVITNIKEYDIDTVATGNRVIITTEATGDLEIEGTLSKMAPTSTLTASGDTTASSTDAEYESEVTVSAEGSKSGMRIGMNAQLSIITQAKTDIFSVPYDAVSRVQGEAVIFEAKQQGDGRFLAQAVPVSTGLENELYIEISGEALSEGMLILSDASGVTEGMAVEIRGMAGEQNGNGDAPPAGFPAGGGGVRMGGMPGMGGPRGG